jgi:hypothetical protein
MSFLAGSIIGTLGLETGGFTQGILGAEGLMEIFPSFVTNFMASPILGLVDLVKESFTAIAETISEAFTHSLESADKLNDMATNAGVAVEALSGLGLVAQQAGSSTEAVADAFKFLGKNMADVLGGDQLTGKVFADLGVQLLDAAGNARPLEEVMLDVADAIANTGEAGKRTQVAMALLGRSGSDLIATLSQGSAAIKDQIATFDQYGAVVSGTAAKSADAFGDLLGEVKIAWGGIQNLLGEPLREALTPVLQQIIEWIRTHQSEIRAFITDLVSLITSSINVIISALNNLIPILATVTGALAGLSIGGPLGALIGGSIGAVGGAAFAVTRPTQITVNTPSFDARDASSQIAAKLTPAVQQSYARVQSDLDLAAQRAAIEAGF